MKIAKWIIIGLLGLTALLTIGGFLFIKSKSMDLPVGTNPAGGDQLAQAMLLAVNKPAFDTIKYMKWDFAGRNQYVWDKQVNRARVTMGENVVLLDLNEITGRAFTNGIEVIGDGTNELIQTAWANWCNDSFWLLAPFKVFDPGTKRTLVPLEGQGMGLLVTYESGGVTPGDSYLWILNKDNTPSRWRMWVNGIPGLNKMGGALASWENWKTLYNGARVSTEHDLSIFQLSLTDLDAGESLRDIGLEEDIFEGL